MSKVKLVMGLCGVIATCSSVASQKLRFWTQGGTGTGEDVAAIADVNGDGYPDFIVATGYGVNPGRMITVHSGKTGYPIHTIRFPNTIINYFSGSIAVIPDRDRDGIPDIAAGVPGAIFDQKLGVVGAVYGYSGKTGRQLFVRKGTAVGDFYGASVAAADVDNDGKRDLIVGVPGSDAGGKDRGKVWMYFANTQRFRIGARTGSLFGSHVASAGDVNRDGHEDIIVVSGSSLVEVFSGKGYGPLAVPLLSFAGKVTSASVVSVGDVNGDGFPDISACDSRANGGSGIGRIYSGKDGTVLLTLGGGSQDLFGSSACGIGDVNRDGFDDFLVGAIQGLTSKGRTGYARAFSGVNGKVLFTIPGGVKGGFFGASVSRAGDTDRDGVMDYLVVAGPKTPHTYLYSGPHLAGYSLLGKGCGSGTPPTLRSLKPPVLGGEFVLELGNMKNNQVGVLAFGLSDKKWATRSLPLDLAFLGMSGCKLYCDLILEIPFNSGPGTIQWKIKVPNVSSMLDQVFFNQFWVADRGANILGVATSNAARGTLGN